MSEPSILTAVARDAGQPRLAFTSVQYVRPLCDEHFALRLRLDQPLAVLPGQFVQILCRDPRYDPDASVRDDAPLLRRAFSVGGLGSEGGATVIDIIFRVFGAGTAWLSRLHPGDPVSILGPLGNTFEIDPLCRLALLVAGGVGHPPLLMLAHALRARGIARLAFWGARSRQLLPATLPAGFSAPAAIPAPLNNVAEWAASDTAVILATDDGTYGCHGTVVDALRAWRAAESLDLDGAAMFVCGPTPMMSAAAQLAAEWGIPCQASLESPMACGMGTCQSCAVKVRDAADADGWRFLLCCQDGPVFDTTRLIW